MSQSCQSCSRKEQSKEPRSREEPSGVLSSFFYSVGVVTMSRAHRNPQYEAISSALA